MNNILKALATLIVAMPLAGHAILVQSIPTANQTLICPADIDLEFNSRVDAARSQIILVAPDHTRRKLQLDSKDNATNRLAAHLAGIKPGNYQLDWQVLAVDGHITRGLINFVVR